MTAHHVYAAALLTFVSLTFTNSCDLLWGQPAAPLELSITVQKEQTQAKLVLTVKNIGDESITLDFNTSQRFDFIAHEAGTQRLYWRWSSGTAFLMVLGRETLEPDALLTYEAEMPYVGLPPTNYQVFGILVSKPDSFTSAPATLDLNDKPLPTQGLEVLGEVILLPPDHPCCGGPAIETFSGQMYLFPQDVPSSFWDATGFPIRAWLRSGREQNQYEILDYVWVIAPLEENRTLLESFVRYDKSGGIAGLIQIIKIYADGSYMLQCCFGGKESRAGFLGMGQFESLTRFSQEQGFWDLQNVYGRPGVVADGFTEIITIFLPNGPSKSVTVYQDPSVRVPSAFAQLAERITSLVGLQQP
jgi:hypothetical protein